MAEPEWVRQVGPRTRLGLFSSMSSSQLILACVGGLVTLTALDELSPSPLALPIAIVVGVAFFVVVTVRYKGMPLANWVLKALAFASGSKLWAAKQTGRNAEQLPRELGDVKIVSVRDRTSLVGMLREKKTLSAVARIELHALGLFDTSEQARRLEAFKRILDDLARESDDRYRVVLLAKHVPRRANAELAYVRSHVDDMESPQVASILQVIQDTQAASHDHEFYVCIRQSMRNQDQTAAQLIERLRSLIERLERADIAIKATKNLLEPRELARLIKDSFDPFGRRVRDELEEARKVSGTDLDAAWPDSARRYAACYESDGAFHSTLWMRGWPNVGVTPGWLRPLTLSCNVPAMTVATILKPDDRVKTLGRLRRKKTRGRSASIFRNRHGQDENSDHSDRADFLERVQREIADGATPWWWETYVTVSAPDRDSLAHAVRKAESAAVECDLTPVVLRFAQADAFTFTLPLGRGLEPEKTRV